MTTAHKRYLCGTNILTAAVLASALGAALGFSATTAEARCKWARPGGWCMDQTGPPIAPKPDQPNTPLK